MTCRSACLQNHSEGNLCIPAGQKEFLFLTDKISQRGKPCTPDIGIDLLLCSDPDIYLLANCRRQGPFRTKSISLSEEQQISLLPFGFLPHPRFKEFILFQVFCTELSCSTRASLSSRSDTREKCWAFPFQWLLANTTSIFKWSYNWISRKIFWKCFSNIMHIKWLKLVENVLLQCQHFSNKG